MIGLKGLNGKLVNVLNIPVIPMNVASIYKAVVYYPTGKILPAAQSGYCCTRF